MNQIDIAKLKPLVPFAVIIIEIGIALFVGIIGHSAIEHWKQYGKYKRSLRGTGSLKDDEFNKAWINTVGALALAFVFVAILVVVIRSWQTATQ